MHEIIPKEEKKLLFALKTRGVNVKTNFKNMFSKTNMSCRLCKSNEEESEIHILKCSEIVKDKSLKDEISKISYSDILGTVDEQIKAVKVLGKKVLKVWNLKLEKLKLPPVDTRCTSSRARVPHIPAILIRLQTRFPQTIVIALFMTLDHIYIYMKMTFRSSSI